MYSDSTTYLGGDDDTTYIGEPVNLNYLTADATAFRIYSDFAFWQVSKTGSFIESTQGDVRITSGDGSSDEIIFARSGFIGKFKDDNNFYVLNKAKIGSLSVAPSYTLDVDGDVYAGTSTIHGSQDTTVTAIVGKIVFQASDSTFYGCRSTVASQKWYPLN